jgi:hypothetical protein
MGNAELQLTKDAEGVCLRWINPYGDECPIHLSYESVEHLVTAIDEFASDAPHGDLKVVVFDVLDADPEDG